MEYIGRLAKILFLAAVFSGAIILSRFQSIRLNRGFMNMINYGRTDTQQLQDAFHGQSYQVYYFWCTPKSFEFRNYLSVNSVIKHLDPDKIVFFFKDYPVVDANLYNTWFHEIRQIYPFLEVIQITEAVCNHNASSPHSSVTAFLNGFNAIPWEEHAVLTSQLTKVDALAVTANATKYFSRCTSYSKMDGNASLPACIVLDRGLYPKDIWTLDTPFGRSMRQLFYGAEEIRMPVPSYTQLTPNIAHVMWIGGGEMDFLFYLSVLSLVYVAEVDKVFIYGEAPTGFYWSILKNNTKVQVVRHPLIHHVYGKTIKSLVHMSDVLRVEIMKRYGGIYLDIDAIVVKPFDREIRSYDAVVSLDGMPSFYGPFPDVISNGVMLGKKDAKFWDIFQETMKEFIDSDYTYNGCRRAYQILERHPDLIRVEPRLQVTCFQFLCRPTWWPGYHNSALHHLSSSVKFDWRNDAHVLHWTAPTPNELKDPKVLFTSTGMWADIGKYILEKSNLTQYFAMRAKT